MQSKLNLCGKLKLFLTQDNKVQHVAKPDR